MYFQDNISSKPAPTTLNITHLNQVFHSKELLQSFLLNISAAPAKLQRPFTNIKSLHSLSVVSSTQFKKMDTAATTSTVEYCAFCHRVSPAAQHGQAKVCDECKEKAVKEQVRASKIVF